MTGTGRAGPGRNDTGQDDAERAGTGRDGAGQGDAGARDTGLDDSDPRRAGPNDEPCTCGYSEPRRADLPPIPAADNPRGRVVARPAGRGAQRRMTRSQASLRSNVPLL